MPHVPEYVIALALALFFFLLFSSLTFASFVFWLLVSFSAGHLIGGATIKMCLALTGVSVSSPLFDFMTISGVGVFSAGAALYLVIRSFLKKDKDSD